MRDANQLAADVPRLAAIAEAADNGNRWEWEGGYPQRVVRVGDVTVVADCFEAPDAPSRFAEFIATFDPPTVRALLALVGTLQQERDAERRWCKHWAERAEAAEAELVKRPTLEEAVANVNFWKDKAVAAEAALAEARQALELLLEWAEKDRGGGYPEENRSEEWYTHRDFARRALADTGDDTKEPA